MQNTGRVEGHGNNPVGNQYYMQGRLLLCVLAASRLSPVLPIAAWARGTPRYQLHRSLPPFAMCLTLDLYPPVLHFPLLSSISTLLYYYLSFILREKNNHPTPSNTIVYTRISLESCISILHQQYEQNISTNHDSNQTPIHPPSDPTPAEHPTSSHY
ncbi:hypothetical protein M8818_004609 [Zalaria obscura]|uniref:Uncharacterized protein n=1 Tax=Zalaria obscura TaxID=2024903 RepID=A0ACC3SBM2_9PEZI